MRALTLPFMAMLGCAIFTKPTCAQVVIPCLPPPATKLESFDTNTSVVILRTTTAVGTVAANAGEVVVKCREVTDVSANHKEQGLAIEVAQGGQLKDAMLIDYDEIASLVSAIDYLTKLDMSATKLNFLDASYTTKGGFRIAALAGRRTGVVQFAVRDARNAATSVMLSRDQMPQVAALINLAKKTLDSAGGTDASVDHRRVSVDAWESPVRNRHCGHTE